jgi:S1-C subfamily serine protease
MGAGTRKMIQQLKKATVAVAIMHGRRPSPTKDQPFKIVGSGFCIDKTGIVITCRHVAEAFMEKSVDEQLAGISPEEKGKTVQRIEPVRTITPHALFYVPLDEHRVVVAGVGVQLMVARTDLDLGILRLAPHHEFPNGFPTVEIEDFDDIHEGMEIATCGFPLGDDLLVQLGTVTSSFTRGIISSIIPMATTSRKDVKAFQLDLRATHGNSGGPVFSWETGRVLGVLQGSVDDQYGHHLFSRAESIYPAFDDNSIERIKSAARPV